MRVTGVAVSLDRHIIDVSALAAPVFDAERRCVAALTIAGPTQRFRAALDPLVDTLKEVAGRASGAIIQGKQKMVL